MQITARHRSMSTRFIVLSILHRLPYFFTHLFQILSQYSARQIRRHNRHRFSVARYSRIDISSLNVSLSFPARNTRTSRQCRTELTQRLRASRTICDASCKKVDHFCSVHAPSFKRHRRIDSSLQSAIVCRLQNKQQNSIRYHSNDLSF